MALLRVVFQLMVWSLAARSQTTAPASRPASATAPGFAFPCDGYLRGLRGPGNFGEHITRGDSAFVGSWHLGEDVWLPAGTPVHSVASSSCRGTARSLWKRKEVLARTTRPC